MENGKKIMKLDDEKLEQVAGGRHADELIREYMVN